MQASIVRLDWNEDVRQMLRDTFHSGDGYDAIAHAQAGIISGRMQLWHLMSETADGLLVTEVHQGVLIIWAYVGRGAAAMLDVVKAACPLQNISRIQYGTTHKGMARLLKRHAPKQLAPTVFEIGV